MKKLHAVSFVLLIVGGLNWLVFALFNWDLGSLFGGMGSMGAKVVYVLVGLAALNELFSHRGLCKMCAPKQSGMNMPSQPGQPGAMSR